MHFFFDIVVASDEGKGLKQFETLPLSYGIITSVLIVIPPGHKGLAHLRLKYHESQLYPLSREEDYHGDDMRITFEDLFPFYVEPFELKAECWNTDESYDHSFLVGINVMLPGAIGVTVPTEAIEAMYELIGYEGAT